jgi:hypothetical protein
MGTGFSSERLRRGDWHGQMRLHPRQFVRFVDGRLPSPATIAYLPSELGVKISCSTTNIQISKDYAIKLLAEHKLRYEHFSLIQFVVDRG